MRFLASVRDPAEAALALAGGADIIDAKEPADGALGAVGAATLRAIVAAVAGRRPVSATIGDGPFAPHWIVPRAAAARAAGAAIVKLGLFGTAADDAHAALAALATAGDARGCVLVMFADRPLDLALLPLAASHGVAGVMLDTADKTAGGLLAHRRLAELRAFVTAAHACGLTAGLAGSLRQGDILSVAECLPDVIGFRGALCDGGARGATVLPARIAAVAECCRAAQQRYVAA